MINRPTWSGSFFDADRYECALKRNCKKGCSRWFHQSWLSFRKQSARCSTISPWFTDDVRSTILRPTLKYLPSLRMWIRRTPPSHSTASSRRHTMRRRRRWGTLRPSPLTPRCELSSTSGCRIALQSINVIRLHNIRSVHMEKALNEFNYTPAHTSTSNLFATLCVSSW